MHKDIKCITSETFCKGVNHVSLVYLLTLGTYIRLEEEMFNLKPNLIEILYYIHFIIIRIRATIVICSIAQWFYSEISAVSE